MTGFVLQVEPFEGRAFLAESTARDCIEICVVEGEGRDGRSAWLDARDKVDADIMFEYRRGWGYFTEPLACRWQPPREEPCTDRRATFCW